MVLVSSLPPLAVDNATFNATFSRIPLFVVFGTSVVVTLSVMVALTVVVAPFVNALRRIVPRLAHHDHYGIPIPGQLHRKASQSDDHGVWPRGLEGGSSRVVGWVCRGRSGGPDGPHLAPRSRYAYHDNVKGAESLWTAPR